MKKTDIEIIDLDKEPLEHLSDDYHRPAGDELSEEELVYDELEEEPSEREDGEEAEQGKSFLHSPWIHVGFGIFLVLAISFIVYRFLTFGKRINPDEYQGGDHYNTVESLDDIFPLLRADGSAVLHGDNPSIVLFGNAPFADDRDSADSLANLIAAQANATVYNCSVSDSYLAAQGATLQNATQVMDAFTFYWLSTAFCLRNDASTNNEAIYQDLFASRAEELSADARQAYDTLMSVDFQTVDVIAICYDGTDYLEGHRMSDLDNDTNTETFTGNLQAGIELIQQTYPEIRIIVMSPPYAYAVAEDGSYKSSDLVRYNDEGTLSSYVISEGGICGVCSVSFVDNLYGTIHEDIASDYLTDNLHLNLKGRKLMAERFVYALNKYNK